MKVLAQSHMWWSDTKGDTKEKVRNCKLPGIAQLTSVGMAGEAVAYRFH